MKLSDFKFDKDVKTSSLDEVYRSINNQRTDYPSDKTIHRLFSEQAARTPDSVAVTDETGSLSYRELEEKSNQLAHFLKSRNPKKRVHRRSIARPIDPIGYIAIGNPESRGCVSPTDPINPFQQNAVYIGECRG